MLTAMHAADDVIERYWECVEAARRRCPTLIQRLRAKLIRRHYRQSAAYAAFCTELVGELALEAAHLCESPTDRYVAIGECKLRFAELISQDTTAFVAALLEAHGVAQCIEQIETILADSKPIAMALAANR